MYHIICNFTFLFILVSNIIFEFILTVSKKKTLFVADLEVGRGEFMAVL